MQSAPYDNELRSLLTLAAQSVGLQIRGYDYGHGSRNPAVLIESGAKEPLRWSSWHNDGDCFRLMVDLGLPVSPPRTMKELAVCNGLTVGGSSSTRFRTRQAVTRAAAAVAKARGFTA